MNVFQPDGSIAKNSLSLLTLPRNEMGQIDSSGTTTTVSSPSFVLLQLPLNYTVDDFVCNSMSLDTSHHSKSNIPNSYFISSSPYETDNNQQRHQNDDVSCVVESKGCSFTVHRIETSNTLIVVPPRASPSISSTTTRFDTSNKHDDDDDDDDDKISESSRQNNSKRSKVDSTMTSEIVSKPHNQPQGGKFTQILPAHIIQKPNCGGSDGSFFLELRPKQIRLSDLRNALHTFDPFNDNTNNNTNINSNDGTNINNNVSSMVGRSIYDLATSLRVSQNEIRQGLQYISAFAIPIQNDNNNNKQQQHCMLADHIVSDCYAAIVTGLFAMSVEYTGDYGGPKGIVGIDSTMFVNHILNEILHNDEHFTNMESILHHCLRLLHKDDPTCYTSKFILDVSKVASCIVRRLFLKKTAPWNEIELFSAWQSELPGVGDLYQVSRSMLRGVAICSSIDDNVVDVDDDATMGNSNSDQRQWHYAPVELLSVLDSQKCFDVMFSYKDRYTIYELEPYLHRLIDVIPVNNDNGDNSIKSLMTELLLRHTKRITEVSSNDGIARTWYQKK